MEKLKLFILQGVKQEEPKRDCLKLSSGHVWSFASVSRW